MKPYVLREDFQLVFLQDKSQYKKYWFAIRGYSDHSRSNQFRAKSDDRKLHNGRIRILGGCRYWPNGGG